MSGNVYEWCQDWYNSAYYQICLDNGMVSNPKGPQSGNYRVLRGGSWDDNDVSYLRVSSRFSSDPIIRNEFCGFRVAMSN